MGMAPHEFLDMLPKYFWRKMAGFYSLRNLKERHEWERVRWQTCLLLNVHVDKGKKIKLTDLIEFEWDKKTTKQEKVTDKNYAEYIKKLEDSKLKKKNNGK
jgi:hypothetical protein